MGRRFEYKSNVWRSSTLTLGKPSPTAVVTGPFRAILFLVNESSSDLGLVGLCFFNELAAHRFMGCFDFLLLNGPVFLFPYIAAVGTPAQLAFSRNLRRPNRDHSLRAAQTWASE